MLHLGQIAVRRTTSSSITASQILAPTATCHRCIEFSNHFKSSQTRTASSSSSSSSSKSTSTSSSSIPPPQLDLSAILDDPQAIKDNIVHRRAPVDPAVVDEIAQLERQAQELRRQAQQLRAKRNSVSSSSSSSSSSPTDPSGKTPGDPALPEARRAEGKQVKAALQQLEPQLNDLDRQIQILAAQLPNASHPRAPIGDESRARTVRRHGPTIDSSATAEPDRDHLALSSPSQLGWTDMPAAARMTGASWPLLTDEGALLELALTNYAMSVAVRHGFRPVMTPDVVRADVVERCGFRPRDEGTAAQTYFVSTKAENVASGNASEARSLCLAGTAEIPLVAMSAQRTFEGADALPRKLVALGRAFRAEAGARGADTRGLYRVHQFSKVEMVVVCAQEDSDRELEELRAVQEDILRPLGLSLRVLDMPTEELGASAYRKYDIEAWMPGRGKWGELSSASNCTDYQSRRLNIRYKPSPSAMTTSDRTQRDRLARPPLEDLDIPTPAALEATALYPSQTGYESDLVTRRDGHGGVGGIDKNRDGTTPSGATPDGSGSKKTMFAHTLNGTAAAIPRLIVALLENGVVFKSDDATTQQLQRHSEEPTKKYHRTVKKGKGKSSAPTLRQVDRVRLPEVLKPFWLGGDRGRVEIEWVKKGEPLRLKE